MYDGYDDEFGLRRRKSRRIDRELLVLLLFIRFEGIQSIDCGVCWGYMCRETNLFVIC